MNSMLQDLRFALRQLRRTPAFAITAILTLALGIGANTAIFSLLDQALLRSLPVRDPQQLVILEGTGDAWNGSISINGGDIAAYFSYPMYKDLRDRAQAFDGLITTGGADIGITRNGVSQLSKAEIVSGNYFTMLGVQPALGRVFTQSDDLQKDANPVAVLSFDYWKTRMGSDPRVVGTNLSINGHPFQIVGVAAPGFRSAVWGETPGVFVPMAMVDQIIPRRVKSLIDHTDRWVNILGRLKPGESRATAQASLAPLWHGLRAEELKALKVSSKHFTDGYLTNSRLNLLPGASGFSYQRDDFQKPLLAIMAMALLVLLIASVNVASLLLVRSAGRVREFSLRYALGAGASRILQQLLLEGILIGIGGGLAGMAIAPLALGALVRQLAGDHSSVAFTSSIDSRLLLFNFAVALGVSILFSLAPALQLRRPDLTSAMGQRTGTSSGSMLSLRRVIVVLQIGLSVLLLIGAGLFVRTMQNLRHVNIGYTTSHLVTFGIDPQYAGYADAAIPALHQRVLDTLAVLPGVQGVAATNDPELADNTEMTSITVAGYTPAPDENINPEAPFVNPAYFSALQVPVLAGRAFTDGDTADHPPVTIVNETFANHYCGGPRNCIGRMAGMDGPSGTKVNVEIVGVVRDTLHKNVRDKADPTVFRPMKQNPSPSLLYLYVHTFTDPAQALTDVRRSMQQLDPALALIDLRTMQGQIDDDLANERLVSLLAVSFGLLATLLAGVGIYGVLAYSTAQRTREIGIRIALGSTRLGVSRIVLSDVLRLAGIGIVVAVPVAIGLSRLLRTQLFGVSSTDPLTIVSVVLVIAAVALIAALIPAGRAASINPTEALRTE
jgi:predicted permease